MEIRMAAGQALPRRRRAARDGRAEYEAVSTGRMTIGA